MTTQDLTFSDAEFWHQPLAERMAWFAQVREEGAFTRGVVENPMLLDGDGTEEFWGVTRYAELVEISKRPHDFCSGQGSTTIVDMPIEAAEFWGSFFACRVEPNAVIRACCPLTSFSASKKPRSLRLLPG